MPTHYTGPLGSNPQEQHNFVGLFSAYFARYDRVKYALPNPSQKMANFVNAVNEEMRQIAGKPGVRPDPLHPLTSKSVTGIMTGTTDLTPELLQAFLGVFRIVGDEREEFLAQGQKVVDAENERRSTLPKVPDSGSAPTVTDATPLSKEQIKQMALARIAANKETWRTNNPEGMKDQPSFQEMLEVSHYKGENFNEFLFERVLSRWNMTQVAFSAHLCKLNENNGNATSTITDTALSNWHAYKMKPLHDSVDVICRAFGIKPAENEPMALHEQMLWKAINGHAFTWGDKKGSEALDAAIAECRITGQTGALIGELVDSCGIRPKYLQMILKISQLTLWRNGTKIKELDKALQFLQLVNPQPPEEMSGALNHQNKALLSLIMGRQFDIDTLLEDANNYNNPGGALFISLTGRHGLVTITPNDIAARFKAEGLECNKRTVEKMRTAVQLADGGRITEAYAKVIIKMVEEKARPLIEHGIYTPLTEKQKERCIAKLTNIQHPRKMLRSALSGELPIGQLVAKTCERRGLILGSTNIGFCKEVGIAHILDFVNGKAVLTMQNAQKIANWLEQNYDFTEEEKSQFIALSRGVNLRHTPDQILDEVRAGALDRIGGLSAIYDYSNLTRDKLAEKVGVKHSTISHSVSHHSGGRIVAEVLKIRQIAQQCGISDNRINDFVDTYDGNEISRKSVLSDDAAAQKPWQTRIRSGEQGNSGWTHSKTDNKSDDN